MFHSLRLRLILSTLVVAVIAVGCVGLLGKQLTLAEFHSYVTQKQATDFGIFASLLNEHYTNHGNWNDVQPLLEQIGRSTEKQLILADQKAKIIAVFPNDITPDQIEILPDYNINWRIHTKDDKAANGGKVMREFHLLNVSHVSLSDSAGENTGILYVAPIFPIESMTGKEEIFAEGLNRTLLIAVLISTVVALLLAIILARYIIKPVEALTEAVRRMKAGNLNQQVEIKSKNEIGELSRAFNSMSGELVQAEKLRRNMVNDVAHELRTPLTNLRSHIEAVQDGLLAPDAGTLDSVHEEILLLQQLIDDLQEISLAEAGQLKLNPERVSVSEEVNLAVKAFRSRLDAPPIKIDIDERCTDILADRQRFRQILRNLLTNAVLHTPPEGKITIETANTPDDMTNLTIKDSGCGIPAEDLPHVFDRFYRSDSSRTRTTGGTGLGLAITKQLVSAQGGEISITSEPGKGTSVLVSFPVFRPQSTAL